MTWWDAVRKWFSGKREEKFPVPGKRTPDRKTEYTGASDWIAKRSNLTTVMGSREIADAWSAKARAQAFFSARVADDRILSRIRTVSDAFSRGEIGQAEARTLLRRFLRAEGLDDGSSGLRNIASPARIDLILTQNARMAAAVGQYQAGRDPDVEKRFPCWRYIRSASSSPRDTHIQYAGKVYRKDDPIWHTIFPPSDFNCKCSVEDTDAPPDTPPEHVETAESGFAFDPAHAFEGFDGSEIQDRAIRKKTEDGLKRMGVVMQPQGVRYGDSRGLLFDETDKFPSDRKYAPLQPVYNAALKGENELKKVIRRYGKKNNCEYVAVYDSDGKPYAVAMGKKGKGSARFDFVRGGTVIHNHPNGATFSTQDVRTFLDGKLERMVVVTEEGEYTLTMPEKGCNVNTAEIIKRWETTKEKNNGNEFEAWKEVFNETEMSCDYARLS